MNTCADGYRELGSPDARYVCGVIVTFHPHESELERLIMALSGQVDSVVVVDNGSPSQVESWCSAFPKVHCLRLGENLGVGGAQNAGIAFARRQEATHVILFDQDSEPAPGMIARLMDVMAQKVCAGERVCAVGPRYVDPRQENPPPFIRLEGFSIRRASCAEGSDVVPVDYLISSGCLISMDALDQVGDMVAGLFIDYIDIEWGLRARREGFQAFGVCDARMGHTLGSRPVRLFGRSIPVHAPFRHYYHFRNAVWLYRHPWVPWRWKVADGYRLFLKYVFYSLFLGSRWEHFWMMSTGVWDGLRGRMGKR